MRPDPRDTIKYQQIRNLKQLRSNNDIYDSLNTISMSGGRNFKLGEGGGVGLGWRSVILVTHFSAWENLLSPKP